MKVIKYILFAALVFALWVTKPIWMPESTYYSSDTSQVDTLVSEQEAERNALLKAQDKELAANEKKFGKKSFVMHVLKAHWSNIYTESDSFELSKCYNVIAGSNGWTVHCTYRLRGEITQNTFTINNGKVSQ